MARPTRRQQPPPDGSWIIEGDEDQSDSDQDYHDEEPIAELRSSTRMPQFASAPPVVSPATSMHLGAAESTRPAATTRKSPRSSHRPTEIAPSEPELVMPTFYGEGLSSSRQSHDAPRPIKRSRVVDRSGKDAANPPTRRTRPSPRHQPSSPEDENATYYLSLLWSEVLRPTLKLALSVFSLIFSILKPLIVIVLAFWILIYLARHAFTTALTRTIDPLCQIPVLSSYLPICALMNSSPGGPGTNPIEFDELMTVQSAFEDVLTTSAGGASLPLDMKRSEASIRDLKQVVQYSTLPSRQELVFELTGFVDTARQASADLSRFNSRIGRAVDHVLSTNRWTLQVLDSAAASAEAQGTLTRLLHRAFPRGGATEDLLLEQYLRHTRALEEQIAALVLEAQALLGILANLDDRLDVIHGITARDGVAVSGGRDELFAQLWTWVGGNRAERKRSDAQVGLLTQLTVYRRSAWEHVSGTMVKLQAIGAGLEDLRERVAAPEVVRGATEGVPLRVHIERIQMGVERLEEQRGEARRVEAGVQRRVLDGEGKLLLD